MFWCTTTSDHVSNQGISENWVDVDAHIGKNPSDEDIPPVVPYSVVLWIGTQQLQREFECLLGVLVPVFLLPLAFRQPSTQSTPPRWRG